MCVLYQSYVTTLVPRSISEARKTHYSDFSCQGISKRVCTRRTSYAQPRCDPARYLKQRVRYMSRTFDDVVTRLDSAGIPRNTPRYPIFLRGPVPSFRMPQRVVISFEVIHHHPTHGGVTAILTTLHCSWLSFHCVGNNEDTSP